MKNEKKRDLQSREQSFPHIVLASSSPRRAELLRAANFSVLIRKPEVDERALRNEKPEELVRRLAVEKAKAVSGLIQGEPMSGVIIAADTIVISPKSKKVLGKPAHAKVAVQMLKELSGKTHTVFTGYSILGFGMSSESGKLIRRVVRSQVTMRSLSENLIQDYVNTGEPMDKAGAYAAQGLGMCFIEKISGSYTNVVGLPVSHVLDDLESEFGIHPRF
jgi:septum formation protein